jgi:hypothetical protein
MSVTSSRHPVRAKSHVLRLLGDELIGDDGLAIFELVKNGYDADASKVSVVMDVSSRSPRIVITDDGHGMSLDDIKEKWLVLATDSKRGEDNRKRSQKYHRLPLGEKGIGRIAAFKLGNQLTIVTRAAGHKECVVQLDLNELLKQGPFLEDLTVKIEQRHNTLFEGKRTGTRIEIQTLHRKAWQRADLRKLYRLVTSLSSPFDTPDSFSVEFSAPGNEKALEGMLGPDDFIDQAIWCFWFSLDQDGFSWKYKFRPPNWKGVIGRQKEVPDDTLLLARNAMDDDIKRKADDDYARVFEGGLLAGIGPISGVIYGFYLRSEVLKASGNQIQLKKWLEDQTGVRVYRDRVRVFNYGEGRDDWLGLNVRRINTPGGRFGTNSLVAAVNIELEPSTGLKEKTNREGFDHNETYWRFQQLALSVFDRFEREAKEDREQLDSVIRGKEVTSTPTRFVDAIENLKAGIRTRKIDASFQNDLEAIEAEYTQLRDVMVSAGTAGLNLAVIFHEVEREVDALAATVERGMDQKALKKQIEQIYYMLHGFAPLLRKNPIKKVFCSEVIATAARLRDNRFQFHRVVFSAPITVKDEPDFKIRTAPNLLVGAIGNLLDNALYWCQVRKQHEKREQPISIRIVTNHREDDGSSLIAVVDNGTGFSEKARNKGVTAFYSERPDGMGLGLYFANLVVEQMGGVLTLESAEDLREEVDIPDAFDGAAVVMRFKGD